MPLTLSLKPLTRKVRGKSTLSSPNQTKMTIRSMHKLSLGWDGEGGVPATSNAVERACHFIDQLTNHFDSIKQPFATATPDGGVLMQWKIAKDNSLEVEFSPTEKGIPAKYSIFNSKTLDSLEGTIRDPENYHRWPYALKLLFLSF